MKIITNTKRMLWPIVAGALVGLAAMLLTVGLATAAPPAQDEAPLPPGDPQHCGECHLNVANDWSHSPHAHAYDDPVFQERWKGLGEPGDCLLCHTTNFQATTGEFDAQGVSCEACHGEVDPNHPPATVPIRSDSEYCGTCHTTTLHEWRLTGHSAAGVGCMDCHNPHSQERLFEVSDNLCINCHKEDMEAYLEDIHVQKDIGCVDCHALVIPPDPIPIDGIVPTGHAFTITPATCVACHTDSLHSGFSLPGYENGAAAAVEVSNGATESEDTAPVEEELIGFEFNQAEESLSPQQQIQALEAALASNQLSTLFQGGLIGLVLGGSTAYFVAKNVRRTPRPVDESEDEEETD